MKSICLGVLAISMIAIHASVTLAASLTLAKDGKSDYVIVLSANPLPANQRAAKELQTYFKQMTGAELPIVDDAKPLPAKAIVIGANKFVEADKKLGNDGFAIATAGGQLRIVGPGPRGSMYGTYELLEKLGVRWLTPKVTRVPTKATVELPEINETQTPAFEYREPYFTEAFDKDWAARNRMLGNSTKLDASTGGTIHYADFVHTFDHLIPTSLYATHPEYFPLVGGKRVNGYVQRCLTNPDVLKIAIEGVKQAFASHPDAVITSVSQNDVDKWCECDQCKALAAKYGGQSGAYLWFVNQVAQAVEKDYPDKLIDTLAYQFTEAPPKSISPRPNVRVRLCPIYICQGHPCETDDYAPSQKFLANLKGWGETGGTLYIWAYCTDFGGYLMPFPDFDEFPADIRLFHKSGVRGVFFEGAYGAGGGGSDAELRSWVMAKLLWDPKLDSDKLVTEWMQGVYGKAEPPMRKWFDTLHQKIREKKIHFQCFTAPTFGLFSDDVLASGDKSFDEAEKLAAGDAVATEYVAKSRLWLRYVKLMLHPSVGDDFKSFIADVKKFGVGEMREGQGVDAWEKEYVTAHKK